MTAGSSEGGINTYPSAHPSPKAQPSPQRTRTNRAGPIDKITEKRQKTRKFFPCDRTSGCSILLKSGFNPKTPAPDVAKKWDAKETENSQNQGLSEIDGLIGKRQIVALILVRNSSSVIQRSRDKIIDRGRAGVRDFNCKPLGLTGFQRNMGQGICEQ